MKTSKASVKKARSYSARQVIKDNNKAFEKMSSAEKRIQIARDTIFQLNAGKLIAAKGLWLGANEHDAPFLL